MGNFYLHSLFGAMYAWRFYSLCQEERSHPKASSELFPRCSWTPRHRSCALSGPQWVRLRMAYGNWSWSFTTSSGRHLLDLGYCMSFPWWLWLYCDKLLTANPKLLPVAYGIGLVFIPKQYRQEKKAVRDNLKRQYDTDAYNMKQRP